MTEQFVGEIRIVAFDFVPPGWARCDGQLLPINQNQALFALLGTTYGGDGKVTFALPDLRGRMPIHTGPGHRVGERGGETAHGPAQAGIVRPAPPSYLTLNFIIALVGTFPTHS